MLIEWKFIFILVLLFFGVDIEGVRLLLCGELLIYFLIIYMLFLVWGVGILINKDDRFEGFVFEDFNKFDCIIVELRLFFDIFVNIFVLFVYVGDIFLNWILSLWFFILLWRNLGFGKGLVFSFFWYIVYNKYLIIIVMMMIIRIGIIMVIVI